VCVCVCVCDAFWWLNRQSWSGDERGGESRLNPPDKVCVIFGKFVYLDMATIIRVFSAYFNAMCSVFKRQNTSVIVMMIN